ncbi:rhodanese-related sulfurtransferase [Melghirimyces profundicolus]|uniref:Rhodanese-related sulfurtransferase n=1 Tax=Melghirimyces profundicolus TaxID=1242148 RepID=A0A2T6BGB9_9BACL|nr:sulfurtransferase TusA family protein [Melghirimyces profundicolus]PTX55113.1 rhodanese-related sulfurtransferase [Melghirimyces profundicolus]
MSQIRADRNLDCKGLACPMPIVRARKAIQELKPGQVLHVEATDQGSLADLKSWAERTGHQYLGSREEDGVLHHFLRKASEREEREEKQHPHVIRPEEVEQRLNGEIQLVDVREPMEYAFGHIPGALSIPLGELEERIEELDPRRETWVICRTGTRSDTACQILAGKGFEKVKNVVPGMKDWQGETQTDL